VGSSHRRTLAIVYPYRSRRNRRIHLGALLQLRSFVARREAQAESPPGSASDAACAETLGEACRSLVSQTNRPVLDIAGVTFIDSSALHVLLETRFTDGVESLVLRNQPTSVRRLLETRISPTTSWTTPYRRHQQHATMRNNQNRPSTTAPSR
jgi:anti-anti-sigma regulatory factor